MIFIDMKKIVNLFFFFLAAVALFVFYKSFGLSMVFLLIIGLLALKFVPVLVFPILLLAIGVHFSGDFSFIADGIVWTFWTIFALFAALVARDIASAIYSPKEFDNKSKK